MRLIAILALVAFSSGAAFAQAADAASDKGKEMSAKAANTTCVCGKPVDAKVAPVAGKTTEGKEVSIGVCAEACSTALKGDAALATKAADAAAKGDKAADKAEKKAEKAAESTK